MDRTQITQAMIDAYDEYTHLTLDRRRFMERLTALAGSGAAAAAIAPLLDALEHAGSAVTDEASAMEAVGQRPRLVPGGAQNFKVTYPDDFALAAAVLSQRAHGATLERYRGKRDQPQASGNPFF